MFKKSSIKNDGVMKIQKISITKMVNKCLLLINQFKSEQKYVNSPLIKQTANDFDITHKKLIGQLTELDQSMQKYMILSVQAASELSGGVLEQNILEQMDKYSQLNIDELIERRIQKHKNLIKGKNHTNKITYVVGDRVRLQNIKTKDFLLKGTVVGLKESDDQKILSYNIQMSQEIPLAIAHR